MSGLDAITEQWHQEELDDGVPMTKPLSRQEAKERACGEAVKEGYALVRVNDTEVWRLYPDGRKMFHSRSEDYTKLWHSALEMVEYEQGDKINAPRLLRFAASVVHNVVIHPFMPFTWGKVGEIVDVLHDVTGEIAYGGKDK